MVKYILLINYFLLKNLNVNLFMCLHLETNSARVSPLIYELESTAHTGKSAKENYYIFTSNQTTSHLSPSKFLPWLVKEYLIFHVIKSTLIKLPLTTIRHLKTVISTKLSNLHHELLKEENATETFYGLIRRLALTWRHWQNIFVTPRQIRPKIP